MRVAAVYGDRDLLGYICGISQEQFLMSSDIRDAIDMDIMPVEGTEFKGLEAMGAVAIEYKEVTLL